jgi:hypothetical protein
MCWIFKKTSRQDNKMIERAIELVSARNQYRTPNLLTDEIQEGANVSQEVAVRTARGICKILTFWIEAHSKDLIDESFPEFYSDCIRKGYITKSGSGIYTWMALNIEPLGALYNIDVNTVNSFEEFAEYKRDEVFLGTVRISAGSGLHSIVCGRNAGGFARLHDTSTRGTDENLFEFVTPDNFKYFTEFVI